MSCHVLDWRVDMCYTGRVKMRQGKPGAFLIFETEGGEYP